MIQNPMVQTVAIVALLIAASIVRIMYARPPASAGPEWKRRNISNTLAALSLALVAMSLVILYRG